MLETTNSYGEIDNAVAVLRFSEKGRLLSILEQS
jgi:hypothetical protein